MGGRHDLRVKNVRKNVWTATGRQVAVEALQVGEPAAEHDDLRIENVDDAGQRPSESRFVALQGCFAGGVAVFGAGGDFRDFQIVASVFCVIGAQGRAAQISFDAAVTSAITDG